MKRFLILFLLLAPITPAQSTNGTNCSTGSYVLNESDNPVGACPTLPNSTFYIIGLTSTVTADEWCTATMGAAMAPDTQYWTANPKSSDVGNGERWCPIAGTGAVDCWPRMWFYETDGGQNYPNNGGQSSYYSNRFFNQGYDHKIDIVTSKCYEVPAPGKYSSQDFKQCVTQPCQASAACCQCPGGTGAKGEQKYNGYPIQKVQSSGCCACTPIVIDTTGKGFEFTNASNGVKFDISGRGFPVQMGWTAKNSGNAFLCLPDADGACPSGRYLFGSAAPQPASNSPNGFLALGVYDDPAHGGNGDGVIDSRDLVFPRLRLWIDANHDGISQPNELFTLPELGITSISLNYKADQRTDQYGNILRYRAQIGRTDGGTRTAYDVIFSTGGVTTACGTALIPQAKTLN